MVSTAQEEATTRGEAAEGGEPSGGEGAEEEAGRTEVAKNGADKSTLERGSS